MIRRLVVAGWIVPVEDLPAKTPNPERVVLRNSLRLACARFGLSVARFESLDRPLRSDASPRVL